MSIDRLYNNQVSIDCDYNSTISLKVPCIFAKQYIDNTLED
jgi:hypothetical protein